MSLNECLTYIGKCLICEDSINKSKGDVMEQLKKLFNHLDTLIKNREELRRTCPEVWRILIKESGILTKNLNQVPQILTQLSMISKNT